MIKHLVICGGGPVLLQIYGSIQHLAKNGYLSIPNIETIYGTSAGAIISVLLCLNYDWDIINDYLIKRPWHEVFQIHADSLFAIYSTKGIFDSNTFEIIFKPLFDAKDISLNITLSEFYQFSTKELHFYSLELNTYQLEDISYLTHPNLPLLTAIQMTCAIPLFIQPIYLTDKCYIDGGVMCNYPLKYALQSGKLPDEIFGFKTAFIKKESILNKDSNIFEFLYHLLFKVLFQLNAQSIFIPNEITYLNKPLDFQSFQSSFENIEIRKALLQEGIQYSKTFLTNLNSTS